MRSITPDPVSAGVNPLKLSRFLDTAEGFVSSGSLPSIQVALAREGEIVARGAFGRARFGNAEHEVDHDTLYNAYSTTKPLIASAIWAMIEDGAVSEDDAVGRWVPQFATGPKSNVTIRHLLTHTAGFPDAAFDVLDWPSPSKRRARFASWELEWEPGSRLAYHATSASWVLAELIEQVTDRPFTEFVATRVLERLTLSGWYLGLPLEQNSQVADVVHVGDAPDLAALESLGLDRSVDRSGDESYLEGYNNSEWRGVGAPGSGSCATASALALFAQAIIHRGELRGGGRAWSAATLADALRVRTGELRDPMTSAVANRSLGLVIAGDESRMYRGFCADNSPQSFGHAGVGGQLMWGDPESGLSFAVLTNGLERNPMMMGMRNLMLSSQAAECTR